MRLHSLRGHWMQRFSGIFWGGLVAIAALLPVGSQAGIILKSTANFAVPASASVLNAKGVLGDSGDDRSRPGAFINGFSSGLATSSGFYIGDDIDIDARPTGFPLSSSAADNDPLALFLLVGLLIFIRKFRRRFRIA